MIVVAVLVAAVGENRDRRRPRAAPSEAVAVTQGTSTGESPRLLTKSPKIVRHYEYVFPDGGSTSTTSTTGTSSSSA